MKSSIQDKTEDSGKIQIDTESNKISTEFQKFITDADYLRLAFYCAFSGWRLTYANETTNILGKKKTKTVQYYTIDDNARIMTEAGSNYVFSAVYPMISQTSSTSTLSQIQIYKLWRTKITSIRYALLDSVYVKGNPYKLDPSRIHDVTTSVLEMYIITNKAEKGFTLTRLAESFITTVIAKSGNSEIKDQGALQKAIEGFKSVSGGS